MTDAKRQNPLLVGEYGTPHNTAPFDQITLADYEEAIMEGMRQEEAAIKEITENPEEPTFENTILPPTDELTRLTKETEKALGREHGTGMVSIDIDILQYDDIRLHLHDWEQDYIKQLYCQIKK